MCAFIVIAGLALFNPNNLVPFAPMGMTGILRGSSTAFFGYLGYDEVIPFFLSTTERHRARCEDRAVDFFVLNGCAFVSRLSLL